MISLDLTRKYELKNKKEQTSKIKKERKILFEKANKKQRTRMKSSQAMARARQGSDPPSRMKREGGWRRSQRHRPSIIRRPPIHSLRVSAEQRLTLPQQTHERVAFGRGRLLLGAPLLPEQLLPRQPLVHGRLARDQALGQICDCQRRQYEANKKKRSDNYFFTFVFGIKVNASLILDPKTFFVHVKQNSRFWFFEIFAIFFLVSTIASV